MNNLFINATRFATIIVYVDYWNLVGTLEELKRIIGYLEREFEMKDLGKTILSWLIDRVLSNWNIDPLSKHIQRKSWSTFTLIKHVHYTPQ